MNNNNLFLLTFLIGNIINPIKSLRPFQKPYSCGKCNSCPFVSYIESFDSHSNKLELVDKSDYDLIWNDYLNDPNPPVKFENYNKNYTNCMDYIDSFEFPLKSKY